MRKVVLAAVLWAAAVAWGENAHAAQLNEQVEVPALPIGVETQPLALKKIASDVPTGKDIGTVKSSWFCLNGKPIIYNAQNFTAVKANLQRAFYAEAAQAGFKTPSAPENLFPTEEPDGEYLIAALLRDETADLCAPRLALKDTNTVKGRLSYTIEWQIYSNTEKRVVAKIETIGAYEQQRAGEENVPAMQERALSISVRKLLASDEFRSLFVGPGKAAERTPPPTRSGPIYYEPAAAGAASIADSVGEVVSILTGDGFGSGFLISADGLLLTNRHVVGTSKYVKVRWPDGFETVGEVLRSNKSRDVALVKTDPRGRMPLRLSPTLPQPGEDVFAIGTPLAARFQNTVTKGIVSAHRVFDGLTFIQADVSVNHGNSGGPLLDKNANVVGITVSGYMPEGAPTGINLFIPIRDALDFLSLKPDGPSKP